MENKKKNSSKKRLKKKNNKKKVFITILVMLLVLILSAAGYTYTFLKSLSNNNEAGVPAEKQENFEYSKTPVNILLMGVDIGDPTGGDNVPTRTDTLMVLNFNPVKKAINIVSVPRDTMVEIYGNTQKINAAHAIDGVPLTISTVENLLNIQINYYAKVDYKGFREIIDALGGIDVTVKYQMDYDDASQDLSIHFNKGENVHLDGKKAEEFFRWRKNNDGSGFVDGDIGRINHQHEFMNLVFEKVKSFSTITKLPALLQVIPKYVKTNMSPQDILNYGLQFVSIDNMNMHTLAGEGQYINRLSYYVYNEEANREILKPLRDLSTPSEDVPGIDVSTLKVQVLNCTNVNGLAGKTCDMLKQKGYANVSAGNGDSKSKSIIKLSSNYKKISNKLKNDTGIKNVEILEQNSGEFDIIISLGDDFNK